MILRKRKFFSDCFCICGAIEFESSSQPPGISSYELSKLIPEEFKGSMPAIEEIESELG